MRSSCVAQRLEQMRQTDAVGASSRAREQPRSAYRALARLDVPTPANFGSPGRRFGRWFAYRLHRRSEARTPRASVEPDSSYLRCTISRPGM